MVVLEATDEWGNRAEKRVRLSREHVEASAPSFAALDPTGFSVTRNPQAVAIIVGVGEYKRAGAAQYADRDALFFADGIDMNWRNGDTMDATTLVKCPDEGGKTVWNPQPSNVTAYTYVYTW